MHKFYPRSLYAKYASFFQRDEVTLELRSSKYLLYHFFQRVDNTISLHMNIFLPTCIVKITFRKWYFVTKIVLFYFEKNCSSDREKRSEAEGREFAKILRSLKSEQFLVINVLNGLG